MNRCYTLLSNNLFLYFKKDLVMVDILKKACSLGGICFDYLQKLQLLRPLELALLTVLCFNVGRLLSYFLAWGNSEFSGFWVLLVALLVSKDGGVKLSDLQWRLFAVALGVAAGFVISSVFGVNFFALFIAVAAVTWACAFFNWHQYQQLAIMSLSVLLVSNYLLVDMAPWAGAIGRVLEAALGGLLAYGVQIGFDFLRNCCKPSSSHK